MLFVKSDLPKCFGRFIVKGGFWSSHLRTSLFINTPLRALAPPPHLQILLSSLKEILGLKRLLVKVALEGVFFKRDALKQP